MLNLPEWYDAGAYWIQNNPGTPFGEALCCDALHHTLVMNRSRMLRHPCCMFTDRVLSSRCHMSNSLCSTPLRLNDG